MTDDQIKSILAGIERRIRSAKNVDIAYEQGMDIVPFGEWNENHTATITIRINGGSKTVYQ